MPDDNRDLGRPMVWIGTSWKMTKTIAESREYVTALADSLLSAGVQPFVLPAHTSLAAVRDVLPGGSPILLGAQNAHWGPEGGVTGEISMRMAADAGARLIEIGHSDRRAEFGETDETVALKARAALDHGLVPLICVGEPAAVRDAGQAEHFVTGQVRMALSRVAPHEIPLVLLAYEPVWAIGTSGRPARPEQVAPVVAAIAAEVAGLSADGCRALLYGGSVTPQNAASLLQTAYVEGLFVGRAAWEVTGFLELLRIGRDHLNGGEPQRHRAR